MRIFSGLERAIYRGLQQFKKLAIISGAFIVLRFPISALLVSYFDQSLLTFAGCQLTLVLIELFVQKLSSPIGFSVQTSLPRLTTFSQNNLIISLVGILSAQLDKLYLLFTVTEREFALYSLGAQVAIGISLLSRGISNVALTEVALAYDRGDLEEVNKVINASIISLARAIIPVSIFVVMFAEELYIFGCKTYLWQVRQASPRNCFVLPLLYRRLTSMHI